MVNSKQETVFTAGKRGDIRSEACQNSAA